MNLFWPEFVDTTWDEKTDGVNCPSGSSLKAIWGENFTAGKYQMLPGCRWVQKEFLQMLGSSEGTESPSTGTDLERMSPGCPENWL